MQPLRAFIVEDSEIILRELVGTLEELAPLSVAGSAADEAGAVQWLRQHGHGVGLVIVDVFLKSGSGLGVLKTAQRLGLAARRVVLTNYATPEMRQRCASLGADRVFDKSTDLDELLAYCHDLAETGPRS